MKVLILGFSEVDRERLNAEMELLITESQCFLFTIVCGNRSSEGYMWAERNGCPVEFFTGQGFPQDIDFLMVKLSPDTPNQIKNYIMTMRAKGAHGRVLN